MRVRGSHTKDLETFLRVCLAEILDTEQPITGKGKGQMSNLEGVGFSSNTLFRPCLTQSGTGGCRQCGPPAREECLLGKKLLGVLLDGIWEEESHCIVSTLTYETF